MTAAGERPIAIQLPPLVIEPAQYQIWLGFCRRYRVTGRVVCRHWRWDGRFLRLCDDPVPGATVEVYDVDCFWWFCRRDLIKAATTNPDGTFEIDFWWCCWPWLPWIPGQWAIDPDLLERIRRLIAEIRPRLPIPLPDPPPDFEALQPYLETLGTALRVLESRQVGLAAPQAAALAEAEIVKRLPPAPELEVLHVWPWWPRRDCQPDLLFRVTQECRGEVQVIYNETLSQTRWNAPTDVTVTLLANENACCIPVCEDPPCGDCFKWAEVGCTPVMNIGGNDPLAPVAADLLGFAFPGSTDVAFARTLSITGVFGTLSGVDYYEIEYSRDGSPFAPLPLNSLGAFTRVFWGPPCPGGPAQWNTPSFPVMTKQDAASVDHFVYESREHFEQNCTPGSWGNAAFPGGGRFWTSNRDLALVWVTAALDAITGNETPLLPDGLYTLRVVGYRDDGTGNLTDRQVMTRCDTDEEEHLVIRLDNRTVPNHPPSVPGHPWGPGFVHVGTLDPDCDFVTLIKNQGMAGELEVGACDIVELTDTDQLTVRFSVTVPAPDSDRHLGGYWMTVHHSESAVFDAIAASVGGVPVPFPPNPAVHPGPTYALAVAQGETRPWWGGGTFQLVLPGSAFPETCAYLFRLHAWKRAFSGCGPIEWFHDNDAEFSITIKKI